MRTHTHILPYPGACSRLAFLSPAQPFANKEKLLLLPQFLKSSSAIKMMNRFSLREHLEEGLAAHNPLVQDLCLKGLNSFVFQQGKVRAVRRNWPSAIADLPRSNPRRHTGQSLRVAQTSGSPLCSQVLTLHTFNSKILKFYFSCQEESGF